MTVSILRRKSVSPESLDRYLLEISEYEPVAREEEARLAVAIREGDEASLDRLVQANLRFVVTIAKKYQYGGASLADLINEGNLGLIRAAHRFDETRGAKFISYAVWWVRQAILQYLAEQSRVVRLPTSRAGELYRVSRLRAAMCQRLGRDPSPAEMAGELKVSERAVAELLRLARHPVSLDAPIVSHEDEAPLLDSLPDEAARPPDEDVYEAALIGTIDKALTHLSERYSERYARVVRMYFGLNGDEPLTMEEIGAHMGVTRERVRQILKDSLKMLRAHRCKDDLETFL